MSTVLLQVEIRSDQDVVHTRQRARLIAELLGFDRQQQTRIGTAVSEIARNAQQYGGGGTAAFAVTGPAKAQQFAITVQDHGPGIPHLDAVLDGSYTSRTGLGLGIAGCRRLLDHFFIAAPPGEGTTVKLGQLLPATAPLVTPTVVGRLVATLAGLPVESSLEEIHTQNQELLATFTQLRQREEQLLQVNAELSETNDGVIALYADLADKAQRLQETESLLRARNAELKGFAYTIAHDLKAPLRGIAGYAQELAGKHQAGLSARAVFCLSQIATATSNLDQLIDDLLQYARFDGELPVFSAVSPRDLVETILHDRQRLIAGQQVEVTLDLPDATLQTWERGLGQVLANLIDNALKYSAHATPPRVGLRAGETDTGWQFIVSDNGIGFDMKYHDRIFGLFNRLVRAEEFEGTGAGLAIVKKVLDKLGGTIRAEAEPGHGATFFVELPTAPVAAETKLSPAFP